MASTLNTKINSYTIDTGIELSQPYAQVPSQTGTITEPASTYWARSGRNPVFESTVNPPNGSGSWLLTSDANNGCYHRTNGGAVIGTFRDHDWSAGAWFKFNSFASGIDLYSPIFRLLPNATSGFEFGYRTYANGSPTQFVVRGGGAEEILVGGIVLNQWYLLSVRRVGTQLIYYINGQSVSIQTRTSTTLQSEFGWGNTNFYASSMNVCNIYAAPSNVITPEIITEIYISGMNLTNVNVSAPSDPMVATATATQGNQRLQLETVKGIGLLHKKIQSYAIETGIEFNSSYQLPPTQTGTVTDVTTGAWNLLGGNAPVFEPTIGPNNGKGSWKFTVPAAGTTFSRIRTTSANLTSRLNDFSLSTGFWFKWNSFPTLNDVTGSIPLFTWNPTSTMGFTIEIGWSTNVNRFVHILRYKSAPVYLDGPNDPQLTTQGWHYWAIRRNGNPGVYEFYLDGVLVYTTESITSSSTVATNIILGPANPSPSVPLDVNISNFYIANYDTVNPTAIAEIWDTGNSQGLTRLSSNVNEVTNSYNLVRGIRFNENYKDPYTQTGTLTPTTEPQFGFNGNAPVWGGNDETFESGWTYTPTGNTISRTRDTGSIIQQFERNQGGNQNVPPDWSLGFWVKVNSFRPDGMSTIIQTEGTTNDGFTVRAGIGSSAAPGSTPGKRQFAFQINNTNPQMSQPFYFGEDLDLKTGEWYYIALTKSGSSPVGNVYLNGFLVKTWNDLVYSSGDITILTIGSSVAFPQSFTISNLYLARTAVIGPDQIKNIWLSRNTLRVIAPVFPLTAIADILYLPIKAQPFIGSAELPMPVIAATAGDSVQIVASFTASALMSNPLILTGQWILIANQQLGTANALSVYPFAITTNLDANISAQTATADAEFILPRLAVRPLTGSGLFVMPTLDIDENYFQKVMELNPIIYINDGQQSPVNYGSFQQNSYEYQNMTFNVDSTQEMQAVNNTKSWRVGTGGGLALFRPTYEAQDWADKLTELYTSRRLSIEFWYYSLGTPKTVSLSDPNDPLSPPVYQFPVESGPLFSDSITDLTEVWGGYSEDINTARQIILIGEQMRGYDTNSLRAATWRDYPDATPERNDWNHVVVTYEPQVDFDRVRRYIYLNGAIVSNLSLKLTQGSALTETPTNDLLSINVGTSLPGQTAGPRLGGRLGLSGSQSIDPEPGVMYDEFAYYPITLTASQVLDHYSFVKAQAPDEIIFPDSFDALTSMGNATVLPVANFEYEADPITALVSQIPQPTVSTGFSRIVAAAVMTGQIFIVEPEHSHGSTITQTQFVAYAESPNAFHLNSIYYDYVQANIAPYRYVTFDSAGPYFDYGSDTDYAVQNFVVNGTVVNPDLGINGKSVKTTGSYTNGGVVFKESEHFDNWGTGNNSWHSSFWMQRALDDNSTGLRVLWNLNGAYDDQNIILYHYQNKLHLQINNQAAAPITITTANNVNPFDFDVHHFVINSHHSNNKNHLYLYMDGLLIADQDINAYNVNVINNPVHVGANSEANNFPRLGVGTLITPFANTALPVVPTNTSVYYDEIYWDKNQILAGAVASLFGAMPNKIIAVIFGEAMTASALSVMPTFITTSSYIADPMTATTTGAGHTAFAVFNNVEIAAPMTASTEMLNAIRRDNTTFAAAFMLASAFIAGAGTPRVVRVAAFTANAELANRKVLDGGILVNGIKIFDAQSAWVQFIKITNEGSLLPMDGVR
jgi:hypothetical protein